MNRTRTLTSFRSGAATLAMIIAVGLMTRDAHAQMTPAEAGAHFGLAVRRAGFALGAALALELLAPRFSLEIEAGELPPSGPPPAPPPPCCYAPPPPPPPMMMFAPSAPPEPEPLRYGLAVSGLFQYPGSGQSPIAGMAASLQVRTSAHSLFGLELQSRLRVQIIERYPRIDHPSPWSDLKDRRLFDIILVLNLADDLL